MHLLHYDGAGGFSLATFHGNEIPPYAILSHTWGRDDEEVSFQELQRYRGSDQSALEHRPGYANIRLCARQAKKDKLHYFWVDTCCINKLSDPELTESINSMFRWYQRAARCYVYLTKEQRWFTRGWTLQELLASSDALFFNHRRKYMGDKTTLGLWLSEKTGIPLEALQGAPLSEFSIEERLSWAKHRQTKREEDAAYSLLGIFGVSMPLVYGEGRDNAYNRLLTAVISASQSRELVQRYGSYLPSTERPSLAKNVGKPPDVPGTMIGPSSPPQDQATGREMEQTWDQELETWVQKVWSPRYQRYHWNRYENGEGWVFLEWLP
ncbi:heterokaryon incompatibility protein-domain-containing protein [Paraphoma chrysanthemicola]|nr:heterokaryon incompatibility protein-domain-containing protein [Paraphoma chrysanthemicola]